MMTTSMVNLLQAECNDNTDELTTALESLPSYESLQETEDKPVIFDDNNEPTTGLIKLLRQNTIELSQSRTTNELSNTVRIIPR